MAPSPDSHVHDYAWLQVTWQPPKLGAMMNGTKLHHGTLHHGINPCLNELSALFLAEPFFFFFLLLHFEFFISPL
jgi:hypothetical protein